MEVHEILDRYEMLYSDKIPVLSDLRRTIIDEDLSSIFRIANDISIDIEVVVDVRKSVIEKNTHSMYRDLLFITAQGSLGGGLIDELRKTLRYYMKTSNQAFFNNFYLVVIEILSRQRPHIYLLLFIKLIIYFN